MTRSSPGTPRTDATYRVGLLGAGIEASLTPPMHIEEGRQLGLDYHYDVFDVPGRTMDETQLVDFLDRLRAAGYQGLNVTHPYKQTVIPLLDELSEDAALVSAVNLITFADGRTVGHNTDWTGFRSAFVDTLGDAELRDVLQLGAGGAGAATVYALLSLGAQHIAVHDLDLDRAAALAARLGEAFPDRAVTVAAAGVDELLGSVDGVVHATPTGMATRPGRAFDPARLRPDAWVAEVVYLPIDTELVTSARAAGCHVLDGSLMAAGQAIDSLRIITGLEPDSERVRAHLRRLIAATPPAARLIT